MKGRLCFFICFHLLFLKSIAQITVGDTSHYYYRFNPSRDILYNQNNDSLKIDLNNDGNIDLAFISYSYDGGGAGHPSNYGCKIYCYGNSQILTDTGVPRDIAKPLNTNYYLSDNTPVNSVWESRDNNHFVGDAIYFDFFEPSQFGGYQPTTWDSLDSYIAVRTTINQDTTYAWINLLVSSTSKITLKAIGSEGDINVVLSTTKNISSDNSTIHLFSDKVIVTITKDAIGQIYTASGQVITEFHCPKGNHTIPVEKLPAGLFIVKVVADNIIAVKKIILEE
jgi:hypothetical protein